MANGNFSELAAEIFYSDTHTQHEDDDPSYLSMMNLMRERVGKLRYTKNEWSIYRVPSRLRELNEDAYTPRIVSIGPIHSGQENLQAMEVHKTHYMLSIFQRSADPRLTFSKFVKAILSMEGRARSCYNEYQTLLVSNSNNINRRRSLAEILLVDSCFVLELFLRSDFNEYSSDPIFGAATICCLQRDLALLENQIPFFVLRCLFDLIMGRCCDDLELQEGQKTPFPLFRLCASFFHLKLNLKRLLPSCRHLLELIHNCYLPRKYPKLHRLISVTLLNCCNLLIWPGTKTTKQKRKQQSGELIHCVTKLRESGIKFVKSTSEDLFDIEFSSKGVLVIPKLRINDTMDSLLRNMIAFEQCCDGTSYHITSYAVLMDYLIDSPADVEFLQQRRIIENYLGHGEEVSNIFNKISKKVFVEDFFFADLCNQVNEYCNLCWPKKREIFVRDYFSSPWKFIGVVAGFVLLLLTVFQTGYTIASYYHNPN